MTILITPQNRHRYAAELDGVYRLRHWTFNEWLGWGLAQREGREVDPYDDQAIHFVKLADDGEVLSCWRAMPTTRPYMTLEVYPEVFGDREPPVSPDIWELSKFCTARYRLKDDKAATYRIIAEMTVAVTEFCVAYGVTELLSVQSAVVTRVANMFLGEPIWTGPTVWPGDTDATLYSYEPSLMQAHVLRARHGLAAGPSLDHFDVLGLKTVAA
ncbi:N-acyl-L-homoserine lactone synthetase [Rhodothalassium salexigens DSM 2132]|uniref:Acyl-homoserine-lactone synthase n=1 Tax=Rhodothalassium salexigens DSM 2132 TaxID=1188247 RepID=A0A4R2PAS7_RHOSA|nr:acyl-homoserine-lactone synthase [Rhodothalassium salexigens]MBB4212470.1 N-acyl-L-homoserine lactone synthetase [Rhodothalassium salexigens DSM 2132]MBK1639540.1 hypothetical protein [Rhodothalassium salexigens DSM 2132]TCP31488.1 N-acyl-L-homoserine lactone synthetase [Rhodothalassium salexigens DSM 2132]